MGIFFDVNVLDERLVTQTEEIKKVIRDELIAIAIQISDKMREQSEEIKKLNVRISELETRLSSQIKMQSVMAATPIKENSKPQPKEVANAPIQQKPVAEQFYAIMVDELQLTRVEDSQRSTAQFVINATGDNGTATFNSTSMQFCLANIEGEVLPYFECDVKSRTPSVIRAEGSVKVEKNRSGVWLMQKPLTVTLE